MDSSTDLIKERLSIADVVSTYVKLERAGKNLKARCPFHKERTPSFNVSAERGTYYCFGCGEKGDIFTFIQKMEGVDFRGALELLASRAGVVLTNERPSGNKEEKERLYEVEKEAMRFFEDTVKNRADVRQYLQGRGLTDQTYEKWHIGYAPAAWRPLTAHLRSKQFTDEELVQSGLSIKPEGKSGDLYDRFRGRIMFPINDVSGRVIAFSGRFFEHMEGEKGEGDPAKYVNSPETPLFHKSRVLYGLDVARASMRKHDFAIVVEGQMDLLMMHQVGYTNTIAASGTALTEDHLKLISHSTKRLVLALDADAAGIKSALRSAALAFKLGFDLRVASFSGGKDPADIGKEDPEALKVAIRTAKSAVEFFLENARTSTKSERDMRKKASDEIVPLIALMQNRIEQAHFIQVTARFLGVPEEDVRAEVSKVKTAPQSDISSSPAVPQKPLGRLMQASALILLLSQDDGSKEKLKKLIGEERLKETEESLAEIKEKLLFQIESDEYNKDSIEELFIGIEKETIKEEIEGERRRQRDARSSGDEKAMHEATIRLQELIRKQHGL